MSKDNLDFNCLKAVKSPETLNNDVLRKARLELDTKKENNKFHTLLLPTAIAYCLGIFSFYSFLYTTESTMQKTIIMTQFTFRGVDNEEKRIVELEKLKQDELKDLVLELTMQNDFTQAKIVMDWIAKKNINEKE